MTQRIFCCILSALCVVACDESASIAATATFRGRWNVALYDDAFFPCHSAETWAVHQDSAVWFENEQRLRRLDSSFFVLALNGPYYVEFVGDTSPVGEYGHLGVLPRALTVRSMTEVRFASPSDCDPDLSGEDFPKPESVTDRASAAYAATRHLEQWERVRGALSVTGVVSSSNEEPLHSAAPSPAEGSENYIVFLQAAGKDGRVIEYMVEVESTGRAVLVSRHPAEGRTR